METMKSARQKTRSLIRGDDAYKHPPLASQAHIRLIEVLPGRGSVHIRFQELDLENESRPYMYLSFVWRDLYDTQHDRNLESVLCGGQYFFVGASLTDFLLEYRNRREAHLLWIDPICISQEDIEERTHQVQMVGNITKRATSTVCWIDVPEPSRVSRIVTHLCEIGRSRCLAIDPSSCSYPNYDPCHDGGKVSADQLLAFQSETDTSIDPLSWRSLDMFLEYNYFKSIRKSVDWVWSKELQLWSKGVTIPWDDLCLALQTCFRYSFRSRLSSPGLYNVLVMNLFRRNHMTLQPGPPIYEVLSTWQGCNFAVTVPRDYLFIPLRVVDRGSGPTIVAASDPTNLDKPYIKAAWDMNVLSLSLARGSSLALSPYTWVPDWRSTRKSYLLARPNNHFAASPRQDPVLDGKLSIGVLSCRGIIADIIKAISTYLPPRRPCDHYTASGANSTIFTEWFEFAESHAKRSRHVQHSKPDLLFRFAETIQARGADTIWEIDWDQSNTTSRMQQFLDFCDGEADETMETRLFYAACFPSQGSIFGITEGGRFCLLPPEAERGDLVCIVYGNSVPIVLSRNAIGGYRNVGESYVNGLMKYDELLLRNCPEVTFDIK